MKPTFDVYQGEDGAWVVHIDTEGMSENGQGPTPLRVYINDGEAVYANPDLNWSDGIPEVFRKYSQIRERWKADDKVSV